MATAAGSSVLEARVVMPLAGAWTADLVLDTGAGPGAVGSIVVGLGGLDLHGTAIAGGFYAGATALRVVGGAGGLGQVLEPKDYRGVPLRIPIEDALDAAGETLSPDSTADALALQLPRWVTFAQPVAELLSALAGEAGAGWRVLADGSVWLGVESWPEVAPAFELLDGDPHLGSVEIGVETPTLVPGVTFLGLRVVAVEHLLTERAARTRVTFG